MTMKDLIITLLNYGDLDNEVGIHQNPSGAYHLIEFCPYVKANYIICELPTKEQTNGI